MPLKAVFLSSDDGNPDGFCLNEPVPSWLSFEGLITEEAEGEVELVSEFAATVVPVFVEEVEAAVADVVEAEELEV